MNVHFSFSIMRPIFRKLSVKREINLHNFSNKYSVSSDARNLSQNQTALEFDKLSQNSILISESKDIYENLALEDWLYTNLNLTEKNIFILLMWHNSPSVVIGRHQNPWTECSLDFCQASGISIARRNSGGGTVYHDLGNLNCSFMSPVQKYNRKNNLQIICDSIRRKWNLNLCISERDDILLDGKYKISGTASKLGRTNTYHHCTFLIDADELKLKQALYRDKLCVESRATPSTRGNVKNLKSISSTINIRGVIEVIKEHYKLVYNVPDENIFIVNPSESVCPGILKTIEHLKSWKWCFGHTPQFTVTKKFPICLSFSKWEYKNLPSDLIIKLSVKKGLIEGVEFNPQIIEPNFLNVLNELVIGKEFSPNIVTFLDKWVSLCSNDIFFKFLKSCILQMVLDVFR